MSTAHRLNARRVQGDGEEGDAQASFPPPISLLAASSWPGYGAGGAGRILPRAGMLVRACMRTGWNAHSREDLVEVTGYSTYPAHVGLERAPW
jgi:hypothetical protein